MTDPTKLTFEEIPSEENYDKIDVLHGKISPLLKEIHSICQEEGMAMITAIRVARSDTQETMALTCFNNGSQVIGFASRFFQKHNEIPEEAIALFDMLLRGNVEE